MYETVGNLEEEACRRKDRLRQLAKQTVLSKTFHDTNGFPESCNLTLPKPIFRNYKPESAEINEDLNSGDVGNVLKEVVGHLEMMKSPITIEDIDIVNLAPRKPDWDLKRDVSRKLEKLERKTQKAIAELIRERLKEGQHQDIFQIVNVSAATFEVSKLGDQNKKD